jgi:hypothetical protein
LVGFEVVCCCCFDGSPLLSLLFVDGFISDVGAKLVAVSVKEKEPSESGVGDLLSVVASGDNEVGATVEADTTDVSVDDGIGDGDGLVSSNDEGMGDGDCAGDISGNGRKKWVKKKKVTQLHGWLINAKKIKQSPLMQQGKYLYHCPKLVLQYSTTVKPLLLLVLIMMMVTVTLILSKQLLILMFPTWQQ